MKSRVTTRVAAAIIVSMFAVQPAAAASWQPGSARSGAPAQGAAAEPESQLTLREAFALALTRNRELSAFSHEVRAAEAAILQAGVLPNPALELAGENLANSRLRDDGDRAATLQIGQLVELGGKRAARVRLAEAGRDLASWDYEAKRIDVLSRVSRSFADVVAAQQGQALAEELLNLAQQATDAVGKRVRAGRVSPIEETRARLALSGSRIEAEQARRQLAQARVQLASLWENPTPRFKAAAGDLEQFPALPGYAQLAKRVRNSPDLLRWNTEILRRRAGIDAEKAKAVPDITVSAGVRRFSQFDDHAFLVGVSIPLPIFDQNRGGILEASRRLDRAMDEQQGAESRLLAELAQAYERLSALRSEIETLRTSVLPGTRSAYDGTTRGYELGRFGLIDVLDAQRALFQARVQYLRALAEYHRGVADIERLIGGALDDKTEAVTGQERTSK